MTAIKSFSVGSKVKLLWNGEAVEIVYQGPGYTTIKAVAGERDVSGSVEVELLDAAGKPACLCGCGRAVEGARSTRQYATDACRVRVAKRKSRGNGKGR